MKKIINLYNTTLGDVLPQCRETNKTVEGYLRSRWREKEERQDMAWWNSFFQDIRNSDFLMGRTEPPPGKGPFLATFDWIVKPSNMTKILNGNYHVAGTDQRKRFLNTVNECSKRNRLNLTTKGNFEHMGYTGNLNADIFENLIKDLFKYFDMMSIPPISTQFAWLNHLAGLPASDIEAAFEKLKETQDRIPKNLPKVIKAALLVVWKDRGRDDRQAWKDYGPCMDCNGSGLFEVRYFHQGNRRWYTGPRYCASCENYLNLVSREAAGTRVTASELQVIGIRFRPGRSAFIQGVVTTSQVPAKNIQVLAKGVSHSSKDRPVSADGKHRSMTQEEKEAFINHFDSATQVAV